MTIALMISSKMHDVARYVPVAPQSAYIEYWLPVCRAFELEHLAGVPGHGLEFGHDDMDTILEELRIVKKQFEQHPPPQLPDFEEDFYAMRVGVVIDAIDEFHDDPTVKFSMG